MRREMSLTPLALDPFGTDLFGTVGDGDLLVVNGELAYGKNNKQ